jgi:hypothetical protein
VANTDARGQEGHGHGGAVEGAHWIVSVLRDQLMDCVRRHPRYRVRVIGHSLGGATAALATMLLRSAGSELRDLECVCFATPPCMTQHLASACDPFVLNVGLGDDIIPRSTTRNIEALRLEALGIDWQHELRQLAVGPAKELSAKIM